MVMVEAQDVGLSDVKCATIDDLCLLPGQQAVG